MQGRRRQARAHGARAHESSAADRARSCPTCQSTKDVWPGGMVSVTSTTGTCRFGGAGSQLVGQGALGLRVVDQDVDLAGPEDVLERVDVARRGLGFVGGRVRVALRRTVLETQCVSHVGEDRFGRGVGGAWMLLADRGDLGVVRRHRSRPRRGLRAEVLGGGRRQRLQLRSDRRGDLAHVARRVPEVRVVAVGPTHDVASVHDRRSRRQRVRPRPRPSGRSRARSSPRDQPW